MYEATKSERRALVEIYNYELDRIDYLDMLSDKVRYGNPIPIDATVDVINYQKNLRKVKKHLKKWWQFWK